MKKQLILFGLSAFIFATALTTNTVTLDAAAKNTTTQTSTKIGVTAAKAVALKHAGLKESEVKFVKAKLDVDDGDTYYEIDFTTSTRKYEYEIDAYNSDIIEYSSKKIKSKNTNNSNSKYIGVSAAKKAALKHADLNADDVVFTKTKLTKDDGTYIYDIEFYSDNTEYEYEINAKTGKIIEFDMDNDNDMDYDD